MLPTTREWVIKGEGDYELRSRKRSRYDPICFHAQQCAEKYLKAHLTEAGVAFPKTHDLSVLLDLVAKQIPSWAGMRSDMIALTDWAVLARYPGTSAGRADARTAVEACRAFRKVARRALGLRGK